MGVIVNNMSLPARFAEFVLKKPANAAGIALICALITFMTWLAAVVIGLVTLRKGLKSGFLLLPWAILPDIALAINQQVPLNWLVLDAFLSYLVPFIFAGLLRYTTSWQMVITIAVGISLLILPVIIELYPHYPTQLIAKLNEVVASQDNLAWRDAWQSANMQRQLALFSKLALGIYATVMIMTSLVNLAIARALQSALFNPGAFKEELLRFKLHKLWLLPLIASLTAWWMSGSLLFENASIILSLPFMLAGLSLLHWFFYLTSRWRIFIMLTSYLFIVVFTPISLLLLMLLGCADLLFNMRRFKKIQIKND